MNKTKLLLILLTTSMLLGLQSNVALAASAATSTQASITYPAYYPAEFDRKGVVSEVNTGTHQVIIEGRQYAYQVDLKVHSPDQKYGSAYNLKAGQTLGFSYTEDQHGKITVTEIWVIDPRDYQGS